MPTDWLRWMVFSNNSISLVANINTPVPVGTVATIFPLGAKLG